MSAGLKSGVTKARGWLHQRLSSGPKTINKKKSWTSQTAKAGAPLSCLRSNFSDVESHSWFIKYWWFGVVNQLLINYLTFFSCFNLLNKESVYSVSVGSVAVSFHSRCEKNLLKVNINKAAGPDNIPGHVVKHMVLIKPMLSVIFLTYHDSDCSHLLQDSHYHPCTQEVLKRNGSEGN